MKLLNKDEPIIQGDGIVADNERIVSESLSDSEKKKMEAILDYIKKNDAINNAKGRELTGKSAATVRRYYKRLEIAGILVPDGTTRDTVYRK